MVRPVTQYKAVKVLAIMLALLQLSACGGDGGSNYTASGSTPVSTGATQPYEFSLTWVAPVARSDGSPLSLADIDGFRVYYGTSAGSYPNIVDVTDGSQTSVTIAGVIAGTYHVVMTTYDTNGLESAYSPELIKTVQ